MNPLAVAGNAGLLIALAHASWWTVTSVVALPRPSVGIGPTTRLRLMVVVPAHNEDAMLGDCIRSLRDAHTGSEREILVVADNCNDDTAVVARGLGATPIERVDPERIGKSFALDFAIDHLTKRVVPPDAILFVDADSTVSRTFFDAIERRLNAGARAVQVHYEAAPGSSPLGRLRRVALLLIHWSRPLGASRLGLGTTFKGNGMALRWDVASAGVGGQGLAEDAAMTLSLADRGIAVEFEPGASVAGYMAQDYASARTQDDRWERGRFSLVPRAFATAGRTLARGNVAAAAGALEVGSLPLSLVVVLALSGGALALLGHASPVLAGASVGFVGAYLVTGVSAARVPLSELSALSAIPPYFAHKAGVYFRVLARPARGWQRTQRSEH